MEITKAMTNNPSVAASAVPDVHLDDASPLGMLSHGPIKRNAQAGQHLPPLRRSPVQVHNTNIGDG